MNASRASTQITQLNRQIAQAQADGAGSGVEPLAAGGIFRLSPACPAQFC